MKLTQEHVINDLLGTVDGKIIFGRHEKLVLTEKTVNNSGNVSLNFYDDKDFFNLDLVRETMDLILSNLERRKILLINPKVRSAVFEYDYNGRYCQFKIHRWVEDELTCYELGFLKKNSVTTEWGFINEKHSISEINKIKLNSGLLTEYISIENFYFYNVIEYFFRQILFIELSEDKVKIREVKPNSKVGDVFKGDNLKNETPFNFTQVDSLWNVKSISVGEFKVRGHFRLQKCGKGFSEVKLIFIDEFIKTKYERRSTREMTFS